MIVHSCHFFHHMTTVVHLESDLVSQKDILLTSLMWHRTCHTKFEFVFSVAFSTSLAKSSIFFITRRVLGSVSLISCVKQDDELTSHNPIVKFLPKRKVTRPKLTTRPTRQHHSISALTMKTFNPTRPTTLSPPTIPLSPDFGRRRLFGRSLSLLSLSLPRLLEDTFL